MNHDIKCWQNQLETTNIKMEEMGVESKKIVDSILH